MPAAYLTTEQATARLLRYDIEAAPSEVELEIASDDLDLSHAFLGERVSYDTDQLREFPRTFTAPGDTAGDVPPRVLDWIALRAYQLSEDDEPDVASEKVDTISLSYAKPKKSRVSRLMKNLLRYYTASPAQVRIV